MTVRTSWIDDAVDALRYAISGRAIGKTRAAMLMTRARTLTPGQIAMVQARERKAERKAEVAWRITRRRLTWRRLWACDAQPVPVRPIPFFPGRENF